MVLLLNCFSTNVPFFGKKILLRLTGIACWVRTSRAGGLIFIIKDHFDHKGGNHERKSRYLCRTDE
ncbi:MAG: hypothetical protein A2Y79_00315 [Deltaproteobacteria bacterium RBG_13_43_22]|nr:MAG: hypothetical protein A2Y79_00315 [Deltaproteobacteria bacterium RBG_13_43_22]